MIRCIQLVQALELDLIGFIFKLLAILEEGVADDYAGDDGHVFEGFQKLRRPIVDTSALGALD